MFNLNSVAAKALTSMWRAHHPTWVREGLRHVLLHMYVAVHHEGNQSIQHRASTAHEEALVKRTSALEILLKRRLLSWR